MGILKIFGMMSFLEFAIYFFAYAVKVEKIVIFKRKFYLIKFAQNEKTYKTKDIYIQMKIF